MNLPARPHAAPAPSGPGAARRLRVAVLALEWPSPARHVGGVGRYAYRLCERIADDVDLTVVTGPDPVPIAGVTLLPLHRRPVGRLRRYYLDPVPAARMVRNAEPDVIHSHGDDWPLALAPRRPPIVRTYHGRTASEAAGGRLLRRMNAVTIGWLESLCRPRYAAAVAVGPDSLSGFRCDHLIPPVVVADPPVEPVPKASVPMVVFVGEFGSRKRGHLALEAARYARATFPDLRLAVVGPPGERAQYPAWVEFHGGASDTDVRRLIAEAWVLLAPSAYEGFGIPAWEAMSNRTAVLGTSNPGLDFLSGGGGACRVVGPGALGPALTGLLASGEDRARLVEGAEVRAFDVARLGDPARYLELYRRLAGQTAPAP